MFHKIFYVWVYLLNAFEEGGLWRTSTTRLNTQFNYVSWFRNPINYIMAVFSDTAAKIKANSSITIFLPFKGYSICNNKFVIQRIEGVIGLDKWVINFEDEKTKIYHICHEIFFFKKKQCHMFKTGGTINYNRICLRKPLRVTTKCIH